MNEKLASEEVIISSPMSFSGSKARLWKLSDNDMIRWLIIFPVILVVWCFVLCWYVIFGVFLIPWRLLRRGQRKSKKQELQHRELLEQVQRSQNN